MKHKCRSKVLWISPEIRHCHLIVQSCLCACTSLIYSQCSVLGNVAKLRNNYFRQQVSLFAPEDGQVSQLSLFYTPSFSTTLLFPPPSRTFVLAHPVSQVKSELCNTGQRFRKIREVTDITTILLNGWILPIGGAPAVEGLRSTGLPRLVLSLTSLYISPQMRKGFHIYIFLHFHRLGDFKDLRELRFNIP